ncbi:MAG: hypothetical protein D9N11_01135 [Ketobacter sp.]|nr:MAG: hypothetical protein D9N11_01135 [Ketobacter sp.]
MKIFAPFLIILSLTACSNRGAYEGIQAGNRNQCLKVPPALFDECMENANKPYDEYERERKEVLEN